MSNAESSTGVRLCACGCGQAVRLGNRFIQYHHRRKSFVEYIEEDRGHETPCWVWQRASLLGADGSRYGQAYVGGKTVSAHRLYYERECGPIPEGLVLDHLCNTTLCVRPGHLEPVTNLENFRRGKARTAEKRITCPCCEGRGWLPRAERRSL